MTALRNVGELASPYFLLEVWERREEINIDPETYATLKRKARSLVRDWRAFEVRGEPPDEDWLARRRDLLGIDEASERRVMIEGGSEVSLLVWQDEDGHDSLIVGDLPGAGDPDKRPAHANEPPSTAFELALNALETRAGWGLLLTGLEVRVYRRGSGISQQYLAVLLDDLVELDDEAHWRAFAGIFRTSAFVADADGVPLVQRVVDESRRHATRLADDMRADVVDAAEALMQGALDRPENQKALGNPSRQLLHRLFEETLYYLYRVLFALYAEARDVLPVSGGGAYQSTYSLDHLVELARSGNDQADGTYVGETLRTLFALLFEGPAEMAQALGIEPVGGELFDPARTKLIDECVIGDGAWRRALTSIALGAPGSPRRKLGKRSSFAELGVDQLGSIYEGLLVLEPFLAAGPRVLVRDGGERRVLDPTVAGELKVVRELQAGDFVLESASGRRKGTGSFYTPVEITEYLTRAALDPLIEPVLARRAEEAVGAASEILSLRVCDPAMGSGAFLVQAARVLGLALARARAASEDGRVTPEMVRRAKRDVVRHCLYGVDLNPLAVVLAKVSLWLETLERGKPLTFLDVKLRCGDSLVGVDVRHTPEGVASSDLVDWPKEATKGLERYLKNEAGKRGVPILDRLKKRKGPSRGGQPRLPGLDAWAIEQALESIAARREALLTPKSGEESIQLELDVARRFEDFEAEEASLRNRFRAAADFWCAQWFGDGEDTESDGQGPVIPAGVGDFEQIVGYLLRGETVPPSLQPQLREARKVARRRKFFHWALEFPEVLVERGGFDAVIGNPPWNTLSPDVKEFFGTFDPTVFRRGVPKTEQERREAELRIDPEIDGGWRIEARYLHELSAYARPESGRFTWFAPDPQLRKGDANVYRLFVERAYSLLRRGGRLAQVLPESVYVSSPSTGVRRHLLLDGQLERCFVFENRKKLFPIDSRIKVVLLTARRGGGPTESFRAAFLVGKNAIGRERAVALEDLPRVLAELEQGAARLSRGSLEVLTPMTWAFPELQTPLDAEIAAHCAQSVPALNLDKKGWNLTFCTELHADRDARRFKDAGYLRATGANRDGLRWHAPDGTEWWPLVEGFLFYELEFPAAGKEPSKWVDGHEVTAIKARRNPDSSSVTQHYRVAWRDVARAVDERSSIAAILPPRTAAKHKAPTVWGGSLGHHEAVALAAIMSSFCFDYLVRFRGATSLTYGILSSIPAPSYASVAALVPVAAEVVCRNADFDALWAALCPGVPRPCLDVWQVAQKRAETDAQVALAYGLSLQQFAAVLSTFPNLDTIQPMLPGEPKSFVTRELALLAYCRCTRQEPADVAELLHSIGVDLPEPRPELRRLDARVERYRQLGAVPYRPTPKGGRKPTDPALIEEVREFLSSDPTTAEEIADGLDEDVAAVTAVLKGLLRDGDVYAEGKGKHRRYYVIPEE